MKAMRDEKKKTYRRSPEGNFDYLMNTGNYAN